jgi:hypothetical protein
MPDAVAAVESVTEEVTQPPVLIAEQEVVFSTAAAVRVRPATTRRGLIAVLRGVFVDSTANAERPRRHYPPSRDSFLEHAAMAREMHKLWTTRRSISRRLRVFGMRFGYTRVSTVAQTLHPQHDLKAAGASKVYSDNMSGARATTMVSGIR